MASGMSMVQQCEPSKGSQCVRICTCRVEMGTPGFPMLSSESQSSLSAPNASPTPACGLGTSNLELRSSSEENLFSTVGFFNLPASQSEAFSPYFLALGAS